MVEIVVSGLYYYPIKSCRGTSLEAATVEARGIQNDRRWLIVDDENVFLTQRELPRLTQIIPQIDGDMLRIKCEGMPVLSVPICQDGPRRTVQIWKDMAVAVDHGNEAAEWLSTVLDVNVRLVRMAEDHVRQVNQQFAKRPTDQTGFSDAYPLLLISEESLADLNTRLATPVPMTRFRPNIVVKNATPFAEDTWQQIRIGSMTFDLVKPCARCVTTTTDQLTGERSKEPLATLTTYRKAANGGVMFGQNVIHSAPGVLNVGTRVDILA